MFINVTTSTELVASLRAAQSGDVIQLAPGDYSAVRILGVNIPGEVTITSADASNPAVLHGLSVENSRGLTFTNLEMVIPSVSNANGAAVGSSSYIRFDNVNVHGAKPGDANAITIRNSDHVSVVNSHIHDAWMGISHLNSSDLIFSNNKLYELQADGIRGGGSSNVVISDNHFTNFRPVAGDHPDAIQFWTTNTTGATRDLTITGNVFVRGSGAAVQGIFVGNETKTPYENVTITGNAIIGGMYHGISLDYAVNARIEGNLVQGYSDMTSWIGVFHTNGGFLAGNQATYFKLTDNIGVVDAGGVQLGLGALGDLSTLIAWKGADLLQWLINAAATPLKAAAAAMQIDGPPGTEGGDILLGGAQPERILGLGGDDNVSGGEGDDYLRGNLGDDVIAGGAGFDDAHGNEGNDTVSGGLGNDWVVGGKDNDQLYGEDGDDIVYGNLGNDICDGGVGNDQVRGGRDNDILSGGAGNDWLSGDLGSDTVAGGSGADTFHFSSGAGLDLVTDFNRAEGDRVQLDPGSVYTVLQQGADTVVHLGGGDQLVLQGVNAASLQGDWLFIG